MKDLGMKSSYRHYHKINRKDRKEKSNNEEKAKTKSEAQLLSKGRSKGRAIIPEDITDEYIDKLIN